MDNIIAYFSDIPSLHRGLILAGGIAFFWVLESIDPLFRFKYDKWRHAWINIFFTATTIIVNFAFAFTLLLAANWTNTHNFGLLNWIGETNIWIYSIIGLLLLDFIAAYLAHLVQHKTAWMWRFHLIHHTDTWIDTTSANRHHPGESVIRFAFTVAAVLALGTPMWLVFLYQALSVVFSQFTHANISIPPAIDSILSWVLVSPDMHKVHHHYVLPYTDSNYGNIFSVWDRLFGTFMTLPTSSVVYGVDTHMEESQNNGLKKLLMIPFEKIKKPAQKFNIEAKK